MTGRCLSAYQFASNESLTLDRSNTVLMFYSVQFTVFLALNLLGLWRVRQAQKRWERSGYIQEAQPTASLLPIYSRLLWLCNFSLVISVAVAQIWPYSATSHNSPMAAVGEAVSSFFRHFFFDLAAWCFMAKGAGRRTYVRALKMATLMGVVNSALRFGYVLTIDNNNGNGSPSLATFFLLLRNGIFALFYFIVWLAPQTRHSALFRRPAARPYAAYMACLFSINLLFITLRFANVDAAYCFGLVASFFFFVISPWVLYVACSVDSLFWQGVSPRTSDPAANQRVAAVFGESPVMPTVAAAVAQADSMGLPLVNFNALTVDVEVHRDASTIVAPLHAPSSAPATALVTLAQDARRAAAPAASAAPAAATQRSIGVLKLLGQGSFARVYKGSYKGRPVAVKLIYAMELTVSLVHNLYREAASLGSLRSRYVVGVEGLCVMPPAVAMVMELCAASLFSVIHGQGEAALAAIDAKVPEYEAVLREQARATAEAKSRWRLFSAFKRTGKSAAAPAATEAVMTPEETAGKASSGGSNQDALSGDADTVAAEQDPDLPRPHPLSTAAHDLLAPPEPSQLSRGCVCDDAAGDADDYDEEAPPLGIERARMGKEESGESAATSETETQALLSHLPPDVAVALQAASSTPAGAAAFCKPALSLRTQVRLALDCCAGVAFLHTRTRPVVHLDIKSGNFLVGRDGVVKIADMELSTRLLASETTDAPMPASACRNQGAFAAAASAAAAAVAPSAAIEVGDATGAVVPSDTSGTTATSLGRNGATPRRPGSASPFIGPLRHSAAPPPADLTSVPDSEARAGAHGGVTPHLHARRTSQASALDVLGPLVVVEESSSSLTGAVTPLIAAATAVAEGLPPPLAPVPETRERALPSSADSYASGAAKKTSMPSPEPQQPGPARRLTFHGHPAFAPEWVRNGRVAALAAAAGGAVARSEGRTPARHGALCDATVDEDWVKVDNDVGSPRRSHAAVAETPTWSPSAAFVPTLALLSSSSASDRTSSTAPDDFGPENVPDGPLFYAHGKWGPWPQPSLALAQLSGPARSAVLLLNRENRFSNLGADGFLVDEDGTVMPPEPFDDADAGVGSACEDAPIKIRRRSQRCNNANSDSEGDCSDDRNDARVPVPRLFFGATPFRNALHRSVSGAARSDARVFPCGASDVSVTSMRDIALGTAANAAAAMGLSDSGVAAAAVAAACGAEDTSDSCCSADDEGDGAGGSRGDRNGGRIRPTNGHSPLPPPPEPVVVADLGDEECDGGTGAAVEPPLEPLGIASSDIGAAGSAPRSYAAPVDRASSYRSARTTRARRSARGPSQLLGATGSSSSSAALRTLRPHGLGGSGVVLAGHGHRSELPLEPDGPASVCSQRFGEVRGCLRSYCTLACVNVCVCDWWCNCSIWAGTDAGISGGLCSGRLEGDAPAPLVDVGLEHALEDSDDGDESAASETSTNGSTVGARSAVGCCTAAAASARRRAARRTLRQRHEGFLRRQLGKRRRALTIPEAVNWLAPEFMRMEPFSTAADVYSLACVLWEIVAREVPYQELTDMLEADQRAADRADDAAQRARDEEGEKKRWVALERSNDGKAHQAAAGSAASVSVKGLADDSASPPAPYVVLDVAPSSISEAAPLSAAQEVVRLVTATPASVRRVLALATTADGAVPSGHGVSGVDVILAGAALHSRATASGSAHASGGRHRSGSHCPNASSARLHQTNGRGFLRTSSMGVSVGAVVAARAAARPVARPPSAAPVFSTDSLPRGWSMPSRLASSSGRAAASESQGLASAQAAARMRAEHSRALLSLPGASAETAVHGVAASVPASKGEPAASEAFIPVPAAGSSVRLMQTGLAHRASSVAGGSLLAQLAAHGSGGAAPGDSLSERSPLPPPAAPPATAEIELAVQVIGAPGPAVPSAAPAVEEEQEELSDGSAAPSLPARAPSRRPIIEVMRELIAYGHYRPPVPAGTHPVLAELIVQGWHPEPSLRPTALEMYRRLLGLYETLNNDI